MKAIKFISEIVLVAALSIGMTACAQECGKYQHAPSPSNVNPTDQKCK